MRERSNHDWSRGADRKQDRREDRYSREKKSFGKNDDSYENRGKSRKEDGKKFSSRGNRFEKTEKSFAKGGKSGKRFEDFKKERPVRRKRAFEEYKQENDPKKRPRVKYDENGERIFSERKNQAPKQIQPQRDEKAVRLNKYIANAGICSRREADVLITTGVITVNNEVVTTLGYKVQPGDVVKYNGRTLRNEKKIYILLNKPKGYITTSDDPQQRKTVMELIDGACRERVYPVGRLDRMTTGLLLLTNDGELTKKLTHPSYGATKVYNAELDRPLLKEDMTKLLEGVELEDGEMRVDDVNWINEVPLDKKKVGVSIHSGKNRIIRRLFEALGYEVKKLDRVYFAGLTKKNLLRGQYRFLEDKEIGFLYMQK
ncbi:MAG: rRNA pseudouridine synthase [Bacteroidales bacterium]|nr:rRNA pseudouridine synthase [Bacteroidales bacterium]